MAAQVPKRERVQRLLYLLSRDLEEKKLSPQDRVRNLEELKVFSRGPNGFEPVCTLDGIRMLCTYAFDDTRHWETSREALRCLANTLLLSEPSRKLFADLGYVEKASEKYSSETLDDEFLLGRILFVLTFLKPDLCTLVEKHNLAENLNNAILRHAQRCSKGKGPIDLIDPIEDLALSETLKLLFNVTHFESKLVQLFNESIPHIFTLLNHRELSDPPLQPPVSYMLNALSNLEFIGHESAVFPSSDPARNAIKLMDLLDSSLHQKYLGVKSEHSFDDEGSVLLTVLGNLYEVAPSEVKDCMRRTLLPTPEERDKPLGRGDSISARLLNLTTAALAPKARVLAGHLLYQLSDSDASKFITNAGYGFASGFLVSNGIPVPQEALDKNAKLDGTPINPVTGQTLEAEERDQTPLAEMTDEMKEREAERLFVLFERLKKTGIVDVKNPVQVAMEEGRFQELPDSDSDSN